MLKTEIFINGTSIDLYDEVSIPMTYSILDIREPEKRSGPFSKTIDVPGSHANNILFSHIWNVATNLNVSGTTTNFSPNFNPNLKASAIVYIDGQQVLKGTAQLLKVNIGEHGNYKVGYEICIYADFLDLITAVGDKMLSDLDISEYNHTLNKTNQVNSWDTSIIKNGSDYINFSGGAPTGEGYIYPMIDYGFNNGTSYNVTEFAPAIYAKTIFDKICNQAGFQVGGSFTTSEYFRRLVIPFCGTNLRLSDTEVQARTFKATNNATQYKKWDYNNIGSGYGFHGEVAFQDDSTGTNFDPGNCYNTSIYKFTAPNAGTYRLDTLINFDVTHFPGSASVSYGATDKLNFFCQFSILVVKANGTTVGYNVVTCDLLQGVSSSTNGRFPINIKSATLTSGTTTSDSYLPITYQLHLDAGDIASVEFQSYYANQQYIGGCWGVYDAYKVFSQTAGCGANPSFGWTRFNFKPGSYFQATLVDTKVNEGDTVTMNNVLPNNVKQKDFLMSIIKMHNLYVLSDKTVPNKIVIDDRNTFYSSGTTRDWAVKLDYAKDREIIPMGELDARDYLFTYKSDNDYYNDRYTKKYNEVYSRGRYSISNDFLKEEVKTELIFSPTPMADYISGIDRIIPQIYSVDAQGVIQPKTSNPRILYYGGIKTTNNTWDYVASSGTTQYTTYPYAGTVDDPTNPSISLDWDSPHEVFWTTTSYTDNNLLNKYWKQALQEVSDADSKIFVGYFKLDPKDLAELDFRDQFYFEGQLWKLNKIYDYDPTINELTKCEFVKLKLYAPYVAQTKRGYGGVTGPFDSGSAYSFSTQRTTQNNNSPGAIGSNNFIASTSQASCRIFGGSYNAIGENCSAVTIIGSSGVTVSSGLSNITVVNSSGTTINKSGQVLVGTSSRSLSSRIVYTNSDYVLTLDEEMVIMSIPSVDNKTVYLPDPTGYDGYQITLKCSSSGGGNLIGRSGTSNIEGSSTITVGLTGTSRTLKAYSGGWYLIAVVDV